MDLTENKGKKWYLMENGYDSLLLQHGYSCSAYMADISCIPYDNDQKIIRMAALIDAGSGAAAGAELFYGDDVIDVFYRVWKEAVKKFGISRRLIVSRGSGLDNDTVRHIACELGTEIIYEYYRNPGACGAAERFYIGARNQFFSTGAVREEKDLNELNSRLSLWVFKYNLGIFASRTGHEEIITVKYEDTEWIEDAFLYQTERYVNEDGTVVINGIAYKAPAIYAGYPQIIRYHPKMHDRTYIYDLDTNENVLLKRIDDDSDTSSKDIKEVA